MEPGRTRHRHPRTSAGSGAKPLHSSRSGLPTLRCRARGREAAAWDLAVESVEEALAVGRRPFARAPWPARPARHPAVLHRRARRCASDPKELAEDIARERESLGLGPARSGVRAPRPRARARPAWRRRGQAAVDRCVVAYVERVTGELAERARRDPLTGILNHRAFHARLLAEAARARRYRARSRSPLRPRSLQGDERPRGSPGGRPAPARVRLSPRRNRARDGRPEDASAATSSGRS